MEIFKENKFNLMVTYHKDDDIFYQILQDLDYLPSIIIDDNFDKNTIKENINKICLVVLIGKNTHELKHIDKKIIWALKNKIGIFGIILPNKNNSEKENIIPVRLQDNIQGNYVEIYNWEEINDRNFFKRVTSIAIEKSFYIKPNLTRKEFGFKRQKNNATGENNIFLSHKKEDRYKVEALVRYIRQLGISIYVDIYDNDLQKKI